MQTDLINSRVRRQKINVFVAFWVPYACSFCLRKHHRNWMAYL
ncbi:hypothetical protein DsansV1_C25g0186411 [Dioscorea sansibarensis]